MKEETREKLETAFSRIDKEDFRYKVDKSSPYFKLSLLTELLGKLSNDIIEEQDITEALLKISSYSALWYEVENE